MTEFIWDEQYSVGIPEIDEHHKQLLKLINLLAAEVEADPARKPSALVQCFITLSFARFQKEERVMAEKCYPGILQHKAEHDELIRMAAAAQEDSEVEIDNFLEFLRRWIERHFTISNPALRNFLLKNARSTQQR